MYGKTKEMDPVGGGHMLTAPPGSANDIYIDFKVYLPMMLLYA